MEIAKVGTIRSLAKAAVVLAGLLVNLPVLALDKIEHLEPTSWWVGMAQPNLQLMVHGAAIGEAKVAIDYPGVTVTALQTTNNPNYLFIDVLIDNSAKAGTFDIVFTSPDGEVLNRAYTLADRESGSATRQGFSAKDTIYLLTPDRFANGDTSNDSVDSLKEGLNRNYKGGRHGGDIQGIIDHLDYVQSMGFTQIWPMPVLQNDMQSYSYHGYSTTDYYQVDARFGTNQLYRQLAHDAAKRGIGLIQDVILNHIGSQHWWMDDMPSDDWINHQGNFVATTHMREALHDPNASQADKVGFNDGWFVPSMPDLNQRQPLLANYLIQNTIWWIEYAQLSGLRVDTYSYSDKDFLAQWTKRIMHEYPHLNIVGEEWSVNPAIVAYWQAGTQRHDDYQSWLPSVMDFPNQVNLVNSLSKPETWASGLRELYEGLASDFLYGDPHNLVVFADNHDMSRIYSQLDEDFKLYKMAMSYLTTVRGIPQVFYGTEILMANPGTDDHGIIRSDFPGGWPDDEISGFTGKGLSDQQRAAQNWLKTLLNWRKKSVAVTQGKMMHYTPKDGIYVYFRYTDQDSVMVIFNKADKQQTLPLARFEERLSGYSVAKDVVSGDAYRLDKALNLPGKSSLVLQLN